MNDEQRARLSALSDRLLELTADGIRCETCKWWRRGGVPLDDECVLVKLGDGDKAQLVTMSGGIGWLNTAPDFVCVEWQSKEKHG